MSDTIVDMPKVAQMLDATWEVFMCKNPLGSYSVRARHTKGQMKKALDGIKAQMEKIPGALPFEASDHLDDNGYLITDDFTPEQALTRMAYKVHGEIL